MMQLSVMMVCIGCRGCGLRTCLHGDSGPQQFQDPKTDLHADHVLQRTDSRYEILPFVYMRQNVATPHLTSFTDFGIFPDFLSTHSGLVARSIV